MKEPETIYEEAFKTGKRVSADTLRTMGYAITGNFLPVGGKYKIFELKDAESEDIAGFCFMAPASNLSGVILPHTFTYYKKRKGIL
jgi:hypothetical protein